MANRLTELSDELQAHWLDQIAHCALGERDCMNETDADQDEIDAFMLENDYERCSACQWFMPSYTFLDDDGEAHEECDECR